MAVYGKFKRKSSSRKDEFLLSPTKHYLKRHDTELSNSSHDVFSSTSNSAGTFNNFPESTDSLFENIVSTTDTEDTPVNNQPSSPILKSVEHFRTKNNLFECFEALEKNEFLPEKRRKISGLPQDRKTTIFTLQERTASNERVQLASPVDFSDDEFSSDITTSLEKLNSRLYELQSKVKVLDRENFTETFESKIPSTFSSINSVSRHYGDTRSFKENYKSLSDEEDESGDADQQGGENFGSGLQSTSKERFSEDTFGAQSSGNCKSLEELRRSGELEISKLECEMLLDQMRKATTSKMKDSGRLLNLKFNLFNKMKSDADFNCYLQKSVMNKSKCLFSRILTNLLVASPETYPINFQLITIFNIDIWKKVSITGALNELISMGDMSLKEYGERFCKSYNNLSLDLLNDWVSLSAEATLSGVTLEMLNNLEASQMKGFTDNEINSLLDFCNLGLQSLDSDSLLPYLTYLRANTLLCQNTSPIRIGKSLVNLLVTFPLQTNDHRLLNLILECIIRIVCNPESTLPLELRMIMFDRKVWSKLWEIVAKNNVLNIQLSLNECEQNQCLIAIGYIFSFITFDSDISASDISSLVIFLDIAYESSQNTPFSILQIHFLGYLGCISYHFLEKFDLLCNNNLNKIKEILRAHGSSKYKPQAILSQEIDKILLKI